MKVHGSAVGPVMRRFGAVLLRSPRYALLVANLARDSRLSGGQKAGAIAALAYALSPVDLVPGIIPVLGQLDDLTVLIGGVRLVLRSIAPEVGAEHLARVGLTARDVDDDVRVLGETARWIGGQVGGGLRRLLAVPAQLLVRQPREPQDPAK